MLGENIMTWRTDSPGWEVVSGASIEMRMNDGTTVIGSVDVDEHWTGEEDIAVSKFLDAAGAEVDWLRIEAWRLL